MTGPWAILCVTDRALCREDFLTRVEKIARAKPWAILLRDKLNPDYSRVLADSRDICASHGVALIAHSDIAAARTLGVRNVHLPFPVLVQQAEDLAGFDLIGASVHSPDEARAAEALGARYLVAGHIFATDSKRGLPPRGTGFLKEVCAAVHRPVFAIGGIAPDKVPELVAAGARGACLMSRFMTCEDPRDLMRAMMPPP